VGIGQSTASEQLAILRRGGLVRSERDGRTVRYCADGAGIVAALGELQAVPQACCPPQS
jgi:DNA-binding transcriptional ArsR family regulator